MLCIRAGGFQPPGQKHSGGKLFFINEVQEMKSPGSGVQGDEPSMTSCGGYFMGGEISRNKQCPKDLRRLRLRTKKPPASHLFIHV